MGLSLSRGLFVVCWGIKDSVWHTMKHSLGSSEVLFHICFARNGTHSEYIAFLNFFPLLEWNVFGSGFSHIPSMTGAKQST